MSFEWCPSFKWASCNQKSMGSILIAAWPKCDPNTTLIVSIIVTLRWRLIILHFIVWRRNAPLCDELEMRWIKNWYDDLLHSGGMRWRLHENYNGEKSISLFSLNCDSDHFWSLIYQSDHISTACVIRKDPELLWQIKFKLWLFKKRKDIQVHYKHFSYQSYKIQPCQHREIMN